MKTSHRKDEMYQFVFLSALLSFPLFAGIFISFFFFGAAPGILTPVAILLGVRYIKRNPYPGPFVDRESERSKRKLFGSPKLAKDLSSDEKILVNEFSEQRKNVWKITGPLLVIAIILLLLSFNTKGFLAAPNLSGEAVRTRGLPITPGLFTIIRYIAFIGLPILAFIATYYWTGFFFSVKILRNWKSIFLNR